MGAAVEHWAEWLASWAVPHEILDAAPVSPWGFPVEIFRQRASTAAASSGASPSARRALEVLPEGGSVLDVGSGAGAASLALVPRAGFIAAVDSSREMLDAFDELATTAAVGHRSVPGAWPEAAAGVEPADVVVCHHVLYNVQELEPFVSALTTHARRRVVVELTAEHPRAWMNDLWLRFHGLERPTRPTADDLVAALRELGVEPSREDWILPRESGGPREEAVTTARTRLCLTADRDAELADALGDRLHERDGRWTIGPREQGVVTLWWG
jgi:SAM-dependent methyltransferase